MSAISSLVLLPIAGAAYVIESISYWWHKVKPLALVGEGIDEKYGRELRVMPLAVQHYVTGFLKPQDLSRLAQTGRRSRAFSDSEAVWRIIARSIVHNPKIASLTIKDLTAANAKEADAKLVIAAQAPKNLYKEKVKIQLFQDRQLVRDFNLLFKSTIDSHRQCALYGSQALKDDWAKMLKDLDKLDLKDKVFVHLSSKNSVNKKGKLLLEIFKLSLLNDPNAVDVKRICSIYKMEKVPIADAIVYFLSKYNTTKEPIPQCLYGMEQIEIFRKGLLKDIGDSKENS